MHRTTFAATVAFLLAKQFAEHLLELSTFRYTVSMSPVSRRDFVSHFQGFANTNGNGLLTRIHVCKPWHFCRQIELVCVVFKTTNANHLAVQMQKIICIVFDFSFSVHGNGFRRMM